jgi:hypothetical protein
VYIGEGALAARLGAHFRKGRSTSRPRTPQELAFADASDAEFSYATGGWEKHQRLELETDLIAAHVLELGHAPPAQFLG